MPRFWRRLVRAARDGQAPGDQRPGVAGPAGLDRQPARGRHRRLPRRFPGRRRAHRFRRHVPDRLGEREQLAGVLEALGRLRLLQRGQQASDVAQRLQRGAIAGPASLRLARRIDTHAERDAPRRAEQVAEHRERVTLSGSQTATPGRPRAARGRRVRSFPGRARRFAGCGVVRRASSRRPTKSRRSLYFIWSGTGPRRAAGKGGAAGQSPRRIDCRFYLRWCRVRYRTTIRVICPRSALLRGFRAAEHCSLLQYSYRFAVFIVLTDH